MKRIVLIAASVLISMLMLMPAYSQEDVETIDNSCFETPRRPPAIFQHDLHNETAEVEECNVCHHVYEDGQLLEDESSEDERCAACHLEKEEGRKPSLMKAFHTNCKGCHESEKAGPLMCGECHVKEN